MRLFDAIIGVTMWGAVFVAYMLAAVDWNPLVVAFAASIPALVALGMGYMTLRHKLAEIESTTLKTLHHVNSGSVIAARALEAARYALMTAQPTEENIAAYKEAVSEVARTLTIQNETAVLIRSMKSPDLTADAEPVQAVLATEHVATGEKLATKKDLLDALEDDKND